MNDSPLILILFFAGCCYLGKIWFDDFRAYQTGNPNPNELPGARPAKTWWILIAILGSIGIVALETGGEYAIGVSGEQSDIAAIFLLAMLAAGFLEELVFRGYLVVQNRGRAALLASIFAVSLLFSLGHVQYYTEIPEEGAWYNFEFSITAGAAWTLFILFINSLWWYALRFLPPNPSRSLLPCFAAHISSNLAVFAVKGFQGHITSWL